MSKNMLDILVMVIAFFGGMAISVANNPLLGVAFLMCVVTVWNVAPKIPQMIKVRTKNDK